MATVGRKIILKTSASIKKKQMDTLSSNNCSRGKNTIVVDEVYTKTRTKDFNEM